MCSTSGEVEQEGAYTGHEQIAELSGLVHSEKR